ncbi:PA0069 family radical SAM protein [Roseovarius sp. A21]|uniref:PA0069 family radical SAM protein n=1 Tax=Roseovarius bejariae TaxID=2576383 RepID=A0A844CSA8_9RHOB|nr:PA0069 family radical SAM protein [Roseovarius bejariae]MRU14116.1 PA0069 family radical SAM protein [Roseovarius bejariae]
MSRPITLDPSLRCPGRGATSNAASRFERHQREYDPCDPGSAPLRTDVSLERPRTLITYNKSPDLPFDRSINPYRGCEHGCIYCFARPTHAWLGMSPGLDFETRLIARPEAATVLERELRAPRYRVAPLAIGTNTDPYQPLEDRYDVTRSCLGVLDRFNHPVAIVTKGTLIERDLDILSDMAARGLVRVGISLTTLDPVLSRRMEPRAPSPKRRLLTIERLAEAGVPVRVMTSPVVPGLTDHEIESLLKAGQGAGASAASWIMLRLPLEVSPLFREWLSTHYPDRAVRVMARVREMHDGEDYSSNWGHRMRGSGEYARMIARRFEVAASKLGLDRAQPKLRCDLFKPPPQPGDQLSLL